MKRRFQSPWLEEITVKQEKGEETPPESCPPVSKAARTSQEQGVYVQWQGGNRWRPGSGFNLIVNDINELNALLFSFQIETKSSFIKSKVLTCFGSTDLFKKSHRLCWNPQFLKHPYMSLNEARYGCQYGRPQKSQTVAMKVEDNDHGYHVKNICLRPSKKLHCPACIIAKECILFTDFKSEVGQKKWSKDKASTIIRNDLQLGGSNLKMERKICVRLPENYQHKFHTLGVEVMTSGTALHKMVDQLHDSASKGEVKLVLKLIGSSKRTPLLNAQNDQGWTALMFAARNGHVAVADALIQKGCDVNQTTKSGQTALDIAKFWNHNAIVDLISGTPNGSALLGQLPPAKVNFFGKNPLDRCSALRAKEDWIEQQMHQPTTRFILFHNQNPFVVNRDGMYELCTVYYTDVSFIIERKPRPVYIFLGLGSLDISETSGDRVAWFALDVSSLHEEQLLEFCSDGEILSSKNRYAIMNFDEMHAGVVAQAKSLFTWHHRYKFCPTCGSVTVMAEAGYKRVCTQKDCISLQGVHNTSYPRLDPVVIMLVISPDKQKCLLGRQKRFPPGMFSCLAGFMEPGETIEDAVRREVMEESGIKVGLVQYHSCQPWPMPMQLMIGCLAYATSNQIQVDLDELETARWFTRQEVAEILSGHSTSSGQVFSIPPKQAIACQLIRAWVGMGSNL